MFSAKSLAALDKMGKGEVRVVVLASFQTGELLAARLADLAAAFARTDAKAARLTIAELRSFSLRDIAAQREKFLEAGIGGALGGITRRLTDAFDAAERAIDEATKPGH